MMHILDKSGAYLWHVGEEFPKISGRVVTFQMDCDELDYIIQAIKEKKMNDKGKEKPNFRYYWTSPNQPPNTDRRVLVWLDIEIGGSYLTTSSHTEEFGGWACNHILYWRDIEPPI